MTTTYTLAGIALLLLMGLILLLRRVIKTNRSLRTQLYEQRSAIAIAMEVRTGKAHARLVRREASFGVVMHDPMLPYWISSILVKDFPFDDDEAYARLLAEELVEQINDK